MLRSVTVNPGTWAQITRDAQALIADQRFAQSGAWRLSHVRIDLPLALAQAPAQEHRRLRSWLSEQVPAFLITGARRDDVALHLDFQKP